MHITALQVAGYACQIDVSPEGRLGFKAYMYILVKSICRNCYMKNAISVYEMTL